MGIAFGEPRDRPRRAADARRTRSSRASPTALAGLAKQRKVRGGARHRALHVARTSSRSRRADGTASIGFASAIIAAGSAPGAHPRAPRRPARDGLDRRARAGGGARAPAGGRRRHHRARDGDGLRRARRADHRGRDARPAHARLRPRSRDARCSGASPSRYEAIHLGTRVAAVEARDEGLRVTFEGDDAPAPQTVRPRPGGGRPPAPTATASAPTRPAWRWTSAA